MDPTRWPLARPCPPARSYEAPHWDSHCDPVGNWVWLCEAGLDRADAGDGGRDGCWDWGQTGASSGAPLLLENVVLIKRSAPMSDNGTTEIVVELHCWASKGL
jgi:hypothetical protein